jgi:hypothetical protein
MMSDALIKAGRADTSSERAGYEGRQSPSAFVVGSFVLEYHTVYILYVKYIYIYIY